MTTLLWQRLSGRSRRGLAELTATILYVPLCALLFAFMLYFGRMQYGQVAVEEAAAAGARWVATTLSNERGCRQARSAIAASLATFYLDPAGADIRVSFGQLGQSGRAAVARIDVSYRVWNAGIPFFGRLGNPTAHAQYVVPVDALNNRYDWRNARGCA